MSEQNYELVTNHQQNEMEKLVVEDEVGEVHQLLDHRLLSYIELGVVHQGWASLDDRCTRLLSVLREARLASVNFVDPSRMLLTESRIVVVVVLHHRRRHQRLDRQVALVLAHVAVVRRSWLTAHIAVANLTHLLLTSEAK